MGKYWIGFALAPWVVLSWAACRGEARQFSTDGQAGMAPGGAPPDVSSGAGQPSTSGGTSGSAAGGDGGALNLPSGGEGGEGGAAPSCSDVDSDVDNCGVCDNACPASPIPGATRTCDGGVCGAACPAGTLGDGWNVCVPVTTIAAGQKFTCALLKTGKVRCWGETGGGIEPVAAGVGDRTFTSISARDDHVCGLVEGGDIVCWGAEPATHSGPFIAVATGYRHACGIKRNQSLQCWSWNGEDDPAIEAPPTGKYKGLAAMSDYGCAIVSGGARDGELDCWGDNMDVETRPAPAGMKVQQVVGGAAHGCAVKLDQSISCWGLLYYPSFPATTAFKALGHGGSTHYCGILSEDDSIFCWGSDGGIGGPNVSPPAALQGFRAVALGGSHTCGVALDGKAVCSGNNTYGQSDNQPGPFQGY